MLTTTAISAKKPRHVLFAVQLLKAESIIGQMKLKLMTLTALMVQNINILARMILLIQRLNLKAREILIITIGVLGCLITMQLAKLMGRRQEDVNVMVVAM